MASGMDDDLVKLAQSGGFDALGMFQELLGGEQRFHAVFLAPLTPSLRSGIDIFLRDGSGPLAGLPQQLQAQGVPEPLIAARQLLQRAQGLLLVVCGHDQGVSTIPQLFHGHLSPEVIDQVIAACGPEFPHGPALRQALTELAAQLGQRHFPHLIAGPGVEGVRDAWLDLAAGCVQSAEGMSLPGAGHERQTDLAWSIATALVALGGEFAIEEIDLLVRCQLLAGEAAAAGQGLDVLIRAGILQDEDLIESLQAFVDGAIAARQAAPAAQWLDAHLDAWEAITGPSYDLALAALRLHAAAGTPAIVPAAQRLSARNRKLARQDLTREPIWRVVSPDPGDLLDTNAAADLLGKSTTAIAKRLEARTMPWHESEGRVRIPRQAAEAWKAALTATNCWD